MVNGRRVLQTLAGVPARLRCVVARRPWTYWVITATLAVATFVTVSRRLDDVEAARAEWGTMRSVWTAPIDVAPGQRVVAVNQQLPVAMVPDAAAELDDPSFVARQHLVAGEVITTADVGRPGADTPLVLVPDEWLAVPIVESPPSNAPIGARVQVAADGLVIATEARVVGRHDDVTLVAVPAAQAALLPLASESSGVALLLVP